MEFVAAAMGVVPAPHHVRQVAARSGSNPRLALARPIPPGPAAPLRVVAARPWPGGRA